MKFNLKTLLVLIFTVCILSALPVAAQKTAKEAADASEETETVEEAIEEEPAQEQKEKAPKAVNVAAKKDDVSIDNCIVIGEDFAESYVKETEDATEYPFVIDLTAFGTGFDSVIIPEEIINAVIETTLGEEPEVAEAPAEEETKSGGKNTGKNTKQPEPTVVVKEDTHLEDIALKLVLADGDYSWRKKSLKDFQVEDGAVKLILKNADSIRSDVVEKPAKDKAVSVSFEPDDAKKCGILLVSKGDKGDWEITGEYMFASIIIFIIAIVLLVFINFLVILAVNLIVIRIYKGRN